MAVLPQMLQLAIKHTGKHSAVTLHLAPSLPWYFRGAPALTIHSLKGTFFCYQTGFEIVLALTLLLSSTYAIVFLRYNLCH